MFTLKSVTIKNFLSIGNQTQSVDLCKNPLTLILGSNLDLGGEDTGQKNGVGKTSLLNAISYGLYGQALNNIRKENLINKINQKNMLVTVEFEKNSTVYRIERGRKPNVLKLYVNNQESAASDGDDESQGDSRETQKFIEQCLGLSHPMFCHLVALNTYVQPFLSMKSGEQREIIEQLLGITALSEKAELLKNKVKITKDSIQLESAKIEAVKSANENVQKSIDSLKIKSTAWENRRMEEIERTGQAIVKLERVDIEAELKSHSDAREWDRINEARAQLIKQRSSYLTAVSQAEKTVKRYENDLIALDSQKCPACEQNLKTHKHKEMISIAAQHLEEAMTYYNQTQETISQLDSKIQEFEQSQTRPTTFYDTVEQAQGHKNNLSSLERALEQKSLEINPYQEQIEELTHTALQPIDWGVVNELTRLKEHQEFLLKLLTNKDSYIRKMIIEQNLSYLNSRISYYTNSLGLPHSVKFENDLNVLITLYGQELDFHNLSRGEMNRVILSTSFAFRDVWENLYQSINLLFIDELLDNGTDASGVENALALLKKMARNQKKNVYLISHREELIGRVDYILKAVKEGGFTSFCE